MDVKDGKAEDEEGKVWEIETEDWATIMEEEEMKNQKSERQTRRCYKCMQIPNDGHASAQKEII